MRLSSQFLPSVFIAGLGASSFSCTDKIPGRPNLVIIFPDEMRGQSMGFIGEEPVFTPNLDKLAGESIVLTNAISNYPVSSPYRAMFLTGKYPHSNGVTTNCNSVQAGIELSQDEICWSDILKEQGYSLGYIGKWHLDEPFKPYVETYNNSGAMAWNEWTPPERRHGFDFWYSYGTFDLHLTPVYWTTHATRDSFHQVNQWGPEHETDIAIRYLKNEGGAYRQKGKPFALVVSMNPPHSPYNQVPQKYLDLYADVDPGKLADHRINLPSDNEAMYNRYRNNIIPYYAMISGVDEQVGRILQAIEDEGLADNTIFLFKSDHGCNLGIQGHVTKNNPYEESVRIPFIMRWPGKIKTGEDDLLISVPDYYPTILDLMGFGDKIPGNVQGISYASIIKGEEDVEGPTSQIYYFIQYGDQHDELLDMGARGVRTSRYTCVWNIPGPGEESMMLFDNKSDPYQLQNIAADNPELVSQLKAELKYWLDYTGDPWIKHIHQYKNFPDKAF